MTDPDAITMDQQWLETDSGRYHATLRHLLTESSPRKRRRHITSMTGAFEPELLLLALTDADRSIISRALGTFTRRKSRAAERWIHQTRQILAQWNDRSAWSVTAQSENMVLFRTEALSDDKTLVVGFTGRSNWLMLPTYRVLQALGPDGYDLLLLRDPHDRFYQTGIPELGNAPAEMAKGLASWVKQAGYSDTIAMGTSAGHLAALYTTLTNQWRHAMLVGGAEPRDVPVFEKLLANSRHDASTSLHHCYSQENSGNARAAEALSHLFSETHFFPYPGVTTHNLLEALDMTRDAVPYIRKHLCA